MSVPPKHNYPALIQEYEQRLASGESKKSIEADFHSRSIHPRTFQNNRTQWHKAHRSTPEEHQDTTTEHHSTPEGPKLWAEHSSTPEHTETPEHPGTLEAHQGTPRRKPMCSTSGILA
jgi:hypothetical protein